MKSERFSASVSLLRSACVAASGLLACWTASPLAAETLVEPPIDEIDRAHWSFQPLVRPELPELNTPWARNPIDLFLYSAWQGKGVEPLPSADRTTLLRRLLIDLTGLPPSPRELERFLSDSSPDAYERLVEVTLASPAHGERWAQHWLDLARFAETDGFEHDKVRPEAWQYRDWVVRALNQDLPYDAFLGWQLAGDELQPGHAEARLATAFCLAGPDMPDINSQEERRHYLLNAITSTVGSVFLGLQLECAQCHDHKYDPISQADFYRLRSLFEPAVHVERNESVGVLQTADNAPLESFVMLRGDFRRRGPEVEPAFLRVVNWWDAQVETRDSPVGRRAALARWLTRSDHPLTARVMVNRLWQYHFGQGLSETPSDFGMLGDQPIHQPLLDWLAVEFVESGWSIKHLHRLIVTSAVYRTASHPNHRAWTAEQTAGARELWPRLEEIDPANLYFSRFPRRRISGETIRDSMLAVAGRLNLQLGGPGVRPPLPEELVQTLLKNQWQESPQASDHLRRSLYVFARRNLRYPVFDVFDRPDANASCPRRSNSTTALQSLLMLNSEFSFEMARCFSGRVWTTAGEAAPAQVRTAVLLAYGRPATDEEQSELLQFLEEQRRFLRDQRPGDAHLALPIPCPEGADPHAAAALTDLCLALLNSNEFLHVD